MAIPHFRPTLSTKWYQFLPVWWRRLHHLRFFYSIRIQGYMNGYLYSQKMFPLPTVIDFAVIGKQNATAQQVRTVTGLKHPDTSLAIITLLYSIRLKRFQFH